VFFSQISRDSTGPKREEGLRMQRVRVATEDRESAKLLVVDLVGLFGGERVALQADGEVQVQIHEVNGALVQTLKAVEDWLEQTGVASAEVSVNEHSYTVEHPERAKTTMASSSSSESARRVAVDDRGSREAVGQQ
jgi:preprotein translocase subunit SecD